MMPLTKEACEKFRTTETPPPPKPTVKRTHKKESKGPYFLLAGAFDVGVGGGDTSAVRIFHKLPL